MRGGVCSKFTSPVAMTGECLTVETVGPLTGEVVVPSSLSEPLDCDS